MHGRKYLIIKCDYYDLYVVFLFKYVFYKDIFTFYVGVVSYRLNGKMIENYF